MVIWLASFPRSGNTMLRMMLRTVFGAATHSKYEAIGDRPPEAAGRWTVNPVGQRIGASFYSEAEGWPRFLARARESEGTYLVKTHDAPEGADKAIYVVRNGLVATDSYRHFLEGALGRPVAWPELVVAPQPFENWSNHLDAWQPEARPETLLLRYEVLVHDPSLAIRLIRDFTGLPVQTEWTDPWHAVHAEAPGFFRRGRTTIPAELTDGELQCFMRSHAAWMERLGYAEDIRFELELRARLR
jgi:hypothetical protein